MTINSLSLMIAFELSCSVNPPKPRYISYPVVPSYLQETYCTSCTVHQYMGNTHPISPTYFLPGPRYFLLRRASRPQLLQEILDVRKSLKKCPNSGTVSVVVTDIENYTGEIDSMVLPDPLHGVPYLCLGRGSPNQGCNVFSYLSDSAESAVVGIHRCYGFIIYSF